MLDPDATKPARSAIHHAWNSVVAVARSAELTSIEHEAVLDQDCVAEAVAQSITRALKWWVVVVAEVVGGGGLVVGGGHPPGGWWRVL